VWWPSSRHEDTFLNQLVQKFLSRMLLNLKRCFISMVTGHHEKEKRSALKPIFLPYFSFPTKNFRYFSTMGDTLPEASPIAINRIMLYTKVISFFLKVLFRISGSSFDPSTSQISDTNAAGKIAKEKKSSSPLFFKTEPKFPHLFMEFMKKYSQKNA
jgi:hypothetical protein